MRRWKIVKGDALAALRRVPSDTVQMCVTSPPYWGLRDYGTARWEGGDLACDHRQRLGGEGKTSAKQNTSAGTQTHQYRNCCLKCNALRIDIQIGLEPTPDAYVATMVEVFREVRQVLKNDGTLWLNLGDSYTGSGKGGNPVDGKQATNRGSQTIGTLYGKVGETARQAAVTNVSRRACAELGMKPKDLVGIPWRVAFALQADGWWLRSDIIWSKPNPMPESIRDRPTKAHEYLFLLAKSVHYKYDPDAIAEPSIQANVVTTLGENSFARRQQKGAGQARFNGNALAETYTTKPTRNKRSVWTITPKPYKGAHFAVMPEALVEPCVLAGSAPDDIVLDPFAGSGTVGVVALRHGRQFLGMELNPAYVRLAVQRIAGL